MHMSYESFRILATCRSRQKAASLECKVLCGQSSLAQIATRMQSWNVVDPINLSHLTSVRAGRSRVRHGLAEESQVTVSD